MATQLPHTLILTRENPEDVFALLDYKGTDRWILNAKMTKTLARSLKRQSNGKIKITDSGKKMYAIGIKQSDIDYITEIDNKPMFKIISGKAIHILGKIIYEDLSTYCHKHNDVYKKYYNNKSNKKTDRTAYIQKKADYLCEDAKLIDNYVDLLQDDINHNTNKFNVSIGDVIAFNYNGKSKYNNTDLLHLIEEGGRSGAGKVVKITKTGVSIRELKAVSDVDDWDRNTIGFRVKNTNKHITFKRILRKYNNNYIPEKTFFGFKDICKIWSYHDLSI